MPQSRWTWYCIFATAANLPGGCETATGRRTIPVHRCRCGNRSRLERRDAQAQCPRLHAVRCRRAGTKGCSNLLVFGWSRPRIEPRACSDRRRQAGGPAGASQTHGLERCDLESQQRLSRDRHRVVAQGAVSRFMYLAEVHAPHSQCSPLSADGPHPRYRPIRLPASRRSFVALGAGGRHRRRHLVVGPPTGITLQGWRLLAIFVATIVASIVRPAPMGAVVFIAICALAITGTMTPVDALTGYSDPIVWLVLCAFMISRSVTKTGLGRRIAFGFIRLLGSRSLGLAYALVATDTVLASIVPSNQRPRGRHRVPDRPQHRRGLRIRAGPDAATAGRIPDDGRLPGRRGRLRDVPDRPGVERDHRQVRAECRWRRAELRHAGSSAASFPASCPSCSWCT